MCRSKKIIPLFLQNGSSLTCKTIEIQTVSTAVSDFYAYMIYVYQYIPKEGGEKYFVFL